MLARHSTGSRKLGHDLKRILLLVRKDVKAGANALVGIVLVEVLERILSKVDTVLAQILLLKKFLSCWVISLLGVGEDNFCSLPLNINHAISFASYASVLTGALLMLMPDRSALVRKPLRLLLSVKARIVTSAFHSLSSHLLLAQLTLCVHGNVSSLTVHLSRLLGS